MSAVSTPTTTTTTLKVADQSAVIDNIESNNPFNDYEYDDEFENLENPPPDVDLCNVFIKYLPPSVTDTGLYTMFQSFGDIISCKVMVDTTTGNSLGYGFCRFSKKEEAKNAIEKMSGTRYGNKILLCKYSNSATPTNTQPSDNLYVKPLLPGTTEEELREIFSQFGVVKECKVMIDKNTGVSRQIGFVRFDKYEDAQSARQSMKGFKLSEDAPPLVVKFAETTPQKAARRAKILANQSAAATRSAAALFTLQQQQVQSTLSSIYGLGNPALPYVVTDTFGNVTYAPSSLDTPPPLVHTTTTTSTSSSRHRRNSSNTALPPDTGSRSSETHTAAPDYSGPPVAYNAGPLTPLPLVPVYSAPPAMHPPAPAPSQQRSHSRSQPPAPIRRPSLSSMVQPTANPVNLPALPLYPIFPSVEVPIGSPYGTIHVPGQGVFVGGDGKASTSGAPFMVDPSLLVPVSVAPMQFAQPQNEANSSDNCNLFIFHLPASIDDNALHELFEPFGALQSVKVMVDPSTGESRGFGFVQYYNLQDALRAISKMNGFHIENKHLKVTFKDSHQQQQQQPPPAQQQQPQQYIPPTYSPYVNQQDNPMQRPRFTHNAQQDYVSGGGLYISQQPLYDYSQQQPQQQQQQGYRGKRQRQQGQQSYNKPHRLQKSYRRQEYDNDNITNNDNTTQ